MKKKFFLTVLLLGSIVFSYACDICGCGTGNYYIGLLPQFNQKFIGVRYQYQYYTSVMKDMPDQFSKDLFQTTELWGGFNIGKKWQVLAILPYHFIHQKTDDGVVDNNGLGDAAVMVNYKLLDLASASSGKKLITQQLWIGGGVKLPTGKFNADVATDEVVALANSQVGTGSTDFMINLTHNLRINKIGVTTNLSYKMNSSNADDYKFGNRFSASSFVFYTVSKNKMRINPNIGLLYANNNQNKLQQTKLEETNGYMVAGSAGIEVGFNRVSVGANIQIPVAQNFADGQTKLRSRGMIHISYSF